MALFNFDATAVKPQETSFSPIPAGNYLALVTSSEMKLLKSGNGTGLSLQLQIVDGQYAKSICRGCSHRIECAEWGIRKEAFGIWGGLAPRERLSVRRDRRINLGGDGEVA